jgi:two-component system sensor histidine kinase MtrB
LLVPLPSRTTLVDPGLAFVYVDVADIDLLQPTPHCVQPPITVWMEELGPGEVDVWTETCGDYVIGYGEVLVNQPGENYAWLVVQAVSRGVEDDPLWELREVLASNSLWIVMGAVIVAVLLAAMVAYPLTRARTMAEAVAGGDLGVRLPVRGRDEVSRMSVAVNTMADRLTGEISELEQANEAQQRFVSDVAHELRTPTAALLASAEALEHPETRDEAAVLLAPQLRRLAALTEDLLEISRMDAGRAHVEPSRIDLMDLVTEVIDDCGSPESVQLVGSFPLEVSTDPARLRVIVRNLVANALQHGAPPVRITVDGSPESVTLAVSDAGNGVPAELRERVFDRFVRGDEARHGSSSGLGLAIAAENARLLGGTLTLDPDGRTFLLNLPG